MARPVPTNVGIIAMDIYFPKTAVSQADLEIYDKVGTGKYTNGLGQQNMAFVGDREDIISISLTAVQNFFEKFSISPADIGRLEVGTETIIDKAKSVKSYLMELLGDNTNVEGVDNLNACYGGTAALLNAIYWTQSKSWDGRFALVVAADIAVYEAGPARPSGGAGAVVMLVGPNAPLVFEDGLQGSYFEHVYDFYKPNPRSEYPTVAGQLSIECYLRAIDHTYDLYRKSFEKKFNKPFSLTEADFAVFHSPFNKLVQKSFARLMYNDFLTNPSQEQYASVREYKDLPRESTYTHKDIGPAYVFQVSMHTTTPKLAQALKDAKSEPGVLLPTTLGNCYCASLYAGLLSLITTQHQNLTGKRVLMFSYGSGLSATMFSFYVAGSVSEIAKTSDVIARLEKRTFVKPKKFTKALALNEKRFLEQGYSPKNSLEDMFPGTFYLEKIDETQRRKYHRLPVHQAKL